MICSAVMQNAVRCLRAVRLGNDHTVGQQENLVVRGRKTPTLKIRKRQHSANLVPDYCICTLRSKLDGSFVRMHSE